jgi:drug/metabolite transporter (DMT)-like permease
MFVSEAYAITAAFCIALSSMFLSELKGRVPLFQLARWQMFAAFAMTGVLSLALGGWRTVGPAQFWQLAGSSIAGIVIASTTYFAAIYAVGPRITALLFSLTAPFAVALGYLFLGETISAWQASGIVLVLCGVVLAIGIREGMKGRDRNAVQAASKTDGEQELPFSGGFWPGVAFGVITALGQAVGSLLARPAMVTR